MNIVYGVQAETFKLKLGHRNSITRPQIEEFGKKVSLCALQNDTAAFQIIINTQLPIALNVGRQPYFSQHGQMEVLRIAPCGPFSCDMNIIDMHTDDDRFWKADALLSSPVLELRAEETRAVWVEAKVPADTPAGQYQMKWNLVSGLMFEKEQIIGCIEADIEVLPVRMHDAADNKMHLDLWQHNANIARKAEVALYSDEHFKVLENYAKSLGELGQKAVTIIASEVPWVGQSCYNEERTEGNLFEYSIIDVTCHADGSFSYDYSKMQKYIDICAKYHIDREISVYGLAGVWGGGGGFEKKPAPDYPDNIRIRYFNEADGTYQYMSTVDQINHYIKSLETYFIETNQIDKVRIAADEPSDLEFYKGTLAHIRSIAPSFKFKAAINHAEIIPEVKDEVFDFVPYISGMCAQYEVLSKYMEEMKDKRFLYYVCCGPSFPNTFLRSDLVESLYLGVLASYAHLDGFLRWNYTVWNDHPREDLRFGGWPAGDTNFVYPAANGAPLLTLRYKVLKRGIQLYELLEMLRAKGDSAALEKAYDFVIRQHDITKFISTATMEEMASIDVNDYYAMKKYIAEELAK